MAMPGLEEMSHCDYVQVGAIFVGLFMFWLLREMFCLVIFFPTHPLSDLITFMICTLSVLKKKNLCITHTANSTL